MNDFDYLRSMAGMLDNIPDDYPKCVIDASYIGIKVYETDWVGYIFAVKNRKTNEWEINEEYYCSPDEALIYALAKSYHIADWQGYARSAEVLLRGYQD